MLIIQALKDIQKECECKEASDILENTISKISHYEIIKTASLEKEAFALGIVLKALKFAAIALSTLLLKSPLRVAIAYNSLSKLIKAIEEGKIK
jgi:hypothetical protein